MRYIPFAAALFSIIAISLIGVALNQPASDSYSRSTLESEAPTQTTDLTNTGSTTKESKALPAPHTATPSVKPSIQFSPDDD